MFSKTIKIGEGQKFDLTQVSTEGITKEEAAKKDAKLIEIFNVLDSDKDGKLSAKELADAMDIFGSYDTDGNKKLSKKELDALADDINATLGTSGKERIKRSDIKDFLGNIMAASKNDEKKAVSAVLAEAKMQQAQAEHEQKMQKLDNEAKKLGYEPTNNEGVYYNKEKNAYVMYDEASKTFKPAKYDNEKKSFEFKTEDEIKADEAAEAKKKEEAAAAAEAEAQRKKEAEAPKSHKYTVQPDESFTTVIKKALKAQGIENPTAEQIEAAKEQFKKDNPGAIKKTKSGYEYLLVGAEVNLPAKVDAPLDKAAAEAQWAQNHPDLVQGRGGSDPAGNTDAADGDKSSKGKANGDLTEAEKKTADESAQKAGYRKTNCAGIYYDEANQQHYKYNTATGKLEKLDAHQVFADGTYSKRGENDDGVTFRNLYDKNGQLIQQEYTKTDGTKGISTIKDGKITTNTETFKDGTKVIETYKDGKKTTRTETYKDGTTVEFSGYDSTNTATKRVEKDKNGNITAIYTFENNADGSFKQQEHDKDGNPIGEPTYWYNGEQITKEEYEKRK